MAYSELQKLIDAKYREANRVISDPERYALVSQEIAGLEHIQAELNALNKFKEAAEREGVNFT